MTLANIRIYAPFMAILLLFSIFAGQPTIANPNALPESVAELLSGKTTDFSSVVSQLPDQQLLSALSAGEMLKFKAAHGEISLDVSGASAFINLINKRLKQSQIVSFVQNDTCCKPVEQREIVYEGQRLIIPAHFTAELDLAIISCAPADEAGSICPDFCVNVFSQSPLTDKILKIDGEAVAPEKISIIQSAGKQQVLYRPDLDIACLLSIGTHTAEIIISNKAEEKVRKNWQFTVGVCDIPTNPMPADLVLLKEVGLPLDKFLPGGKAFGELTALIYQNAKGERFIEYRLKAETGQIFTSQNLAFIARKAFKGRNTDNELQLFPKTHFAFAGNSLRFSYAYSGPGQVINEKWEIPSAGHSSADPVIIMTDNDVYARCVITVEEQFTNNNGEIETYTYQVTAEKRINSIGLKTSIQPDRSLIIADSASCSLSIGNITLCRLQTSGMVEGQQYNVTTDITGAPVTGVLKVNRLRWVKRASEGFSTVIDPVATTTTLLFEEPGYAELVLAVDLTWQEAGETYASNYKPDVSGLYAFYPVTGKAKFTKYPIGQIRYTNRHLVIKSFEFTIKDQQITIDEPSDYQLTNPVHICSSAIWPASSPIIIDKAFPFLLENNSYWFHENSDFTVTTPMVTNNDPKKEFKLKLGCEFYYIDDYHSNRQIISELPSIPIFSELDVLELNTIPDKQVTAYEGAEVKFSAEILPKSGFGSGKITAVNNTLDILNGYKVSVENLSWFDLYNENPDNENPETDPVKSALNSEFSHTLIAWDTGSRTVKCLLDARIKDSDTASDISVLTEKKVPVNILPGLNIYSPIEDLAYPLHGSVKVKTSFDSDKKLWNEIKWYLNGKLIEPGVKEPPFFIDLNRTGKWSLGASLKINNPGGEAPPPLAATVTFLVQPVDISLSPYRKVLDLAEQKSQSLSLAVALNGKTAEKPGDLIPWQSDEVFAVVEPVQWKTAQVPDGFASEEFDEESFSGNLNFTSHGAATILATVTVRLTGAEKVFKRRHKKEDDEFEIPIFEFPAVRADLWAVDKPVWLNLTSNLPDEQFPGQAVAPAGRTFKIKNGIVALNKDTYEWSSQTGFKTRISIPAAITDSTTLPATCKTVNFEWSCEGNAPSHDITFIPTFKKAGTAIVKLKSSLVFDDKYEIPFVEKNFPVTVENIENLVEYYVEPRSHEMFFSETQVFNFALKLKESLPAFAISNDIELLNGVYKLSIEEVNWRSDLSSKNSSFGKELDYNFSPPKPGKFKIIGNANCRIEEIASPHTKNKSWVWQGNGQSTALVKFPNVEFEFQYNDWTKVYGYSDDPKDSVAILLKITPRLSLEDLTKIDFPLKIHSSHTFPEGYLDLALTKADYKFITNENDVMVIYKSQTLQTLGILPPDAMDAEDEFCSCDNALPTPETSNHSDSEEFDILMKAKGFLEMGKARDDGDYSNFVSPANCNFLKHAGTQTIWFTVRDSVSERRQVRNQVDWFYWSGHGHHKDAHLVSFGEETAPSDVLWDGDLDVAIISGCSVLDIKDFRAKSFDYVTYAEWFAVGGDWSPGAMWEKTGPKFLVGNNWAGPSDVTGTKEIIANFLSAIDDGISIPEAWKSANPVTKGPNACVIDCSKVPHEYWYWDETSGSPIWSKVIKGVDGW